jgi:hypothetical protein
MSGVLPGCRCLNSMADAFHDQSPASVTGSIDRHDANDWNPNSDTNLARGNVV